MSNRKVVWIRPDIRDPEIASKRGRRKSEIASAPPVLPLETMVRVEVGGNEWSTKLQWIADLLSDEELTKLYAAISKERSLSIGKRRGRAGMVISAHVPPVDTE